MLRNFVIDTDLKKYYPKIANLVWSTQSDYSTQITEAFNIVLDDFRSKEIDPRNLMVPIDLKRPASQSGVQNALTSSTETTTTTSLHVDGRVGFNRLVANVTAITSTGYSVALWGSNDVNISAGSEPTNWTLVTTLALTATGETSVVFQNEFKYYRYVNTVTGSSVTFTLSLIETYVDRLIIHKALEMIFRDISKQENDRMDGLSRSHAQMYSSALQSAKFSLDADDDNLPDETEGGNNAQVRLSR